MRIKCGGRHRAPSAAAEHSELSGTVGYFCNGVFVKIGFVFLAVILKNELNVSYCPFSEKS